MLPARKIAIALLSILPLTLATGCDDRVVQVAREAANRQAEQNATMAELQQEVATGARRLVDADTQARTELLAAQRDLQAENARLRDDWQVLEDERRLIATQRRTESWLVPLLQVGGAATLVALVLGFSWYALIASRSATPDSQLQELLIQEVLLGASPLGVDDEASLPQLEQVHADVPRSLDFIPTDRRSVDG